MIRNVLPLLLLVAGSPAAQNQTEEPARAHFARAIKVIPVPALVGALPQPDRLPFGTMIDWAPVSVLGDGEDARVQVMDLADLVRDLTPLPWDDGDVTVDVVGNALLVTGSPDQIHLVEQTLQQLMASLGEPYRLRAAAFAVEAGADLPAVGASFDELRARLGQLGAEFEWETSTRAAVAQTVDLGSLVAIPYVADCEVEIAQNSTMADPITKAMHVGTALQVQVHPLVGSSDAVLMVQYACGEATTRMREIALGKDDTLPRLQSPTLAFATGCFSGRIANGGALVLLADGQWAGRRFGLILGADRTPPSADAERALGVFPLGAFFSHALRQEFFRPDDDEEPSHRPLWTPPIMVGDDAAPALDPADAETWNTLFRRALGDDADSVSLHDGLAIVRGSAAAKQTAARLIELMQAQFLSTIEAEWRIEGDARGAALQRIRLPMLLGRRHCLVHGIETTGVLDASVEVAQKSGVANPKVVRHFTGAFCVLSAFRAPGNGLATSVRARVVDTRAGGVYVPDNKRGIPHDQATVARSRHVYEGRVPADGQTIEFGQGASLIVDQRPVRARPTVTLRVR